MATRAELATFIDGYFSVYATIRQNTPNLAPTLDEWIKANGSPMEGELFALPDRLVTPRSRQCYWNAWQYKRRRPKESLTYCEGYAALDGIPIPILHGWLLDSAGRIIDPSVDQDRPRAYYGVRFSDGFALPAWVKLRRKQAIGILGNLWRLQIHPDHLIPYLDKD